MIIDLNLFYGKFISQDGYLDIQRYQEIYL